VIKPNDKSRVSTYSIREMFVRGSTLSSAFRRLDQFLFAVSDSYKDVLITYTACRHES
jgi:hypothetical protein